MTSVSASERWQGYDPSPESRDGETREAEPHRRREQDRSIKLFHTCTESKIRWWGLCVNPE